MGMVCKLDGQTYRAGKEVWNVIRLIELAKDLKTFKIPLKHLNIYNLYPIINNTLEYVDHVKRVVNADLSCPIILDEEGYVMDGRHRVAKALLNGKKKILAVRFKDNPYRDYEINEE